MRSASHLGACATAVSVLLVALAQGGCSSAGPASQSEVTDRTSEAVDTICNKPPSASLDGFPVYPYCGNFNVWTNNGIDTASASGGAGWVQTEGGYGYQCVEWAVRYFYFKWNVPHGWFVGYAKDMCTTYPAGVTKTTTPVHGDLAVFGPGSCGADATAGHVAAISSVATSTISVVQENPAGTSTWNKSCVMCYLHAAGNGGASDPCSTAPVDGLYCGQSPQWGGGQKDVLYDCQGGVTKTKTTCAYGCFMAPPNVNDSCNPAPPDAGSAGDGATASDAQVSLDGSAAHEGGAGGDSGGVTPPTPGVDGGDNDGSWDNGSAASTGSSGGCAVAKSDDGAGAFGWLTVALGTLAVRRRRKK